MTEMDITALEIELRTAQFCADIATLDRLISWDLLFTGPDGALITKADDLDAYRKGIVQITVNEPEELHVRRVGSDAFLVSLRVRLAGNHAGTPFSAVARYTRVWSQEVSR